METLKQEILKLLTERAMTAGDIRNRLNGQGWDVSQDEVAKALHSMFEKGQIAHDQRLHFGAPLYLIMRDALWSLTSQ